MRKIRKGLAVLVISIAVLTGWAPWVTDDFATSRVVEKLGGLDRPYNYLGETMPLRAVPKTVVKIPFGALVYFPNEAVYIVTFFGAVL